MTHSGSTLEENIPPGQERSQQKIRSTAALLELVERQKRRKALRAQGTSRPDDQVRLDTYEHSHVVQQDKIAAKTMVSCSSQTCFVQAELRREKSLTEISNLGPSETRVTIESQVSAAQTFVGTPQHFRSNEPRPVSSTSPQQSHTESGTRIRIAASTDIACRPHTSGSSPGARTPPKSPRTPANGNPGTPLSPRTAPNRSPNAKTNPSKSPRISRTPSAGERLGNQTTPPRLCRSKSDPSPKKEVSPRKSPKKTLASSPKSRSSDVLQVKPLVNTYHAITKRPHIQPRRGIPREFQSRNIKEAFTWSNGTADPNVQKKKTTSTAGVGDPLGRNQYATPDAFPVEKIRSEPANSGHPTPRTPSIQSIPPSAVKSGRTEAKPANDVDSVLTGGVTRIEKLYDELTDEYHMPSCHVSSKRQSSKPLVSNAFYPSPPRNLASKCVAMYVPLHGNAKKPTATKPPRVRKYNRSEVLAFMKRKRLERRGLTHSWHAASKETPSGGSDRAIEEPEAVKAKTSKVITENEERFLPIDLTGNVSKLAKDLAVAARQMDADSPELEHFVRLLNKFDSGVTDLLSKCGFDEARLRDAVQKYTITDAPVEERLDKAMKQFEMLLVRLGLRESKLVVEQTSSDGSAISSKIPAESTPPRPRTISLQSSQQDTPRPKFGPKARAENPISTVQHSCSPTVREPDVVAPGAPLIERTLAEASEKSVQTDAVVRDPNFIHEWRDKYLFAGLHSSTPKHPLSTTQEQVPFNDSDVSHISQGSCSDSRSSAHSCDSAMSEIDNSALDQARQVLGQLKVSGLNIGKAQQALDNIPQMKNDSTDSGTKEARASSNTSRSKSTSRASKGLQGETIVASRGEHSHSKHKGTARNRSSLIEIEGDDILEEAKRVLDELDTSRKSSKSSVSLNIRSNVSRNLMDSFDKAALDDLNEAKGAKHTIENTSPRIADKSDGKRFAPEALSCLVTNELDFLEDCNDTLLKMSEVSRAQCYAFAKEANMANEFLRKDRHAASTPIRANDRSEPCPAVPAVPTALVEELRQSLQNAFDQIEQQSREMSLLKKDMSTSKEEARIKAKKSRASPALSPATKQTPVPVRSKSKSEPVLGQDSTSNESVDQEDGSKTSDLAQTTGEARSVNYNDEEKSQSVTVSSTDGKGYASPQRPHRTSEDDRGDQDSESVSQDTRSRSSDTEKSAKSSVSVSTVKTLNSKLDAQGIPVRTESKGFSTERDAVVDGKESTSSDTLSKMTSGLVSTISTDKELQQSVHRGGEGSLNDDALESKQRDATEQAQHVKDVSGLPSAQVTSLPANDLSPTSRAPVVHEGSAKGEPLVSALVEYMERGERLWEEHRSEGFRLLKGVAAGLSATSATASSNAPSFVALESYLVSKMPEQLPVSDRKDHRSEVHKLLSLLAKRKISQEKANREKVASVSTSSSGQQSTTSSSSDESGEILQGDPNDVVDDSVTKGHLSGNGVLDPTVAASSNKGASSNSVGSTSRSVCLGSADLIENADLLRLLVKRNAEIAQKEKFVKYLERERQKIERRSEAIKKREAKLMAEMKAALERERESKISLVRDALSVSNKEADSVKSGNEPKDRQSRPSLRPRFISKPRNRTDSSGSEDIASMSETDASDIEGSRRALRDEEERETRQLERLRKVLETPEATRRPGRKEILRRIEVLERLLANNRDAMAMLESATHVTPKIRRPRVAVKEKMDRPQTQESEESDVSIASKDSISSEKLRPISETEKDREEKSSSKSKEDVPLKIEPTVPSMTATIPKASEIERNDSSIDSPLRSASPSQRSVSEKSLSAPFLGANGALEKDASNKSDKASHRAASEVAEKIVGVNPEEQQADTSSSGSDLHSLEVKSSSSSSDTPNTKERKVDAAMVHVMESLKEDTIKEVVKATHIDEHSSRMMERLVGEAIGDIFKANAIKPSALPAAPDMGWLSESAIDELSPISSLNGTLAQIGQQIFVDDASQQVCIRKIPNRPPPPYTPPKASSSTDANHQPKAVSIAPSSSLTSEPRQPEPVVPMTLGELQTEASHAAEYLYAQLASGRSLDEASYEQSHCDGVADMAKLQYGEMLFDVAKETAEKMFRVGRNSHNMFLRPLPPKERQQAFIDALVGAVLAAERSKSTRPKGIWSYINSRRMDYIDFIMGKEVREEEREWTEYTRCLEQVREQLVEQLTEHIVDTNIAEVLAAL